MDEVSIFVCADQCSSLASSGGGASAKEKNSKSYNQTLNLLSTVYCCNNLTRVSAHSSGIELMNAAALLLLLLLNLLLVRRQERLKRSEMVRRLKGIVNQLNGKLDYLINRRRYIVPWPVFSL